MLPPIAIAAFNHVLSGETWACKRLQSFAGKSVHISIFPLIDLSIMIQADGKFMIDYTADTNPDTSLIIPSILLPRLISGDKSAADEIKISGDVSIADELLFIVRNLHWDIEEDLSFLLGDVLAHRMIKAGQNLIQWQSTSALNLSQAMIEFLTEEKSILTSQTHIDHLISEIHSLQDQTTHLEERINRLINLLPCKAEKNISLQAGRNENELE